MEIKNGSQLINIDLEKINRPAPYKKGKFVNKVEISNEVYQVIEQRKFYYLTMGIKENWCYRINNDNLLSDCLR